MQPHWPRHDPPPKAAHTADCGNLVKWGDPSYPLTSYLVDNWFSRDFGKLLALHMSTSDAKAIKRHAAQYDLFNRIHSIAYDQAFVDKVAQGWYDGRFEVVRELYPRSEYRPQLSVAR